MLTVVGPGGIGKTSVALAVAERLLPVYPDGVWLVDLSTLGDPGFVTSTVGTVLGLQTRAGDALPGLIASLREKKLLLVLDNCEHVIEATAALAAGILRGAPGVHILATSREPLRVAAERVSRLSPLASPSASTRLTAAEALTFPAVQLFVERAAASSGQFELRDVHAQLVGEICRKLDGIPLAIELAAPLVEVLGVQGLAARLDERFQLLTSGRRASVPRHHTLSATLDWSYQLLSPGEQRVLRCLAIFAGGFTPGAAGAVATDASHPEIEVIDQVAELVAKSLVVADVSEAEPRLRLLETTRAYALNKLVESGEQQQIARRHAEYYRTLFERAEAEWQKQPPEAWMAEYCRHIDDLRAALDWAFSPGGDSEIGIVVTIASAPVWSNFELVDERNERTLPDVDSERIPRRVQLLIATGIALLLSLGPVERTKMVLSQALDLAKSLGDVHAQMQALRLLWNVHSYCGECDAAKSIAEHLARLARQAGDRAGMVLSDRMTGHALLEKGKLREAQECFERLLHEYVPPHEQRDPLWFIYDQRILARTMLARVLLLQGLVDQAARNAEIALERAQAADHKLSVCWVYGYGVCPVALMRRDFAAAERAATGLIDLATDLNAALWLLFGRYMEGRLLIGRGEFARGLPLLQTVLKTCDRTGWTIARPQLLAALADGLAGLGQLNEALATINQALARAGRTGELWYKAELLRIKGELLHKDGGDRSPAGEECFRTALELAREQGALSLELRVATSLTRLRCEQGRPQEARDLLAGIYARFTEGFETADLTTAKLLLEELD